jgi:DNA-binding GntR family transcriptional regulator
MASFRGPRFHVPAETAFCWTEIYVDGRLAPIVRPIDVLRNAVFVMVEDQAGEPIVEIRQDIHPCVIDAAKAPILGSKVGELALQITRAATVARADASGSRTRCCPATGSPIR